MTKPPRTCSRDGCSARVPKSRGRSLYCCRECGWMALSASNEARADETAPTEAEIYAQAEALRKSRTSRYVQDGERPPAPYEVPALTQACVSRSLGPMWRPR